MTSVDERIRQLPPDLQREVHRYIDELAAKARKRGGGRKLDQRWAGGLRDFRDQYSSLDLQRKALEWWGD